MVPSPVGGGLTSSIIQVLAFIVPIAAIVLVAVSVPGFRSTIVKHVDAAKEYFYGPPPETEDVGPSEETGPYDAEAPAWMEMSIYDEEPPET